MIEHLKLGTGLALIRYEGKGARSNAIIRALIPEASRGQLTLMTDPNARGESLGQAGDFWIVRCQRPAVLTLEIEAMNPSEPVRGGVTVEYLGERPSQERNSQLDTKPPNYSMRSYKSEQKHGLSLEKNRIIAHIAKFGDISVDCGIWLRGDAEDQAIEGLMLPKCGMAGVVLRSVATGQIAQSGEFLGSRGQARPLCGLEIWIDGIENHKRIEAEAIYKKAGFLKASGTKVMLSGLDDFDPLMAVKVSIADVAPLSSSSLGQKSGNFNIGQRAERMKLFKR